jgi:hypothetical protein
MENFKLSDDEIVEGDRGRIVVQPTRSLYNCWLGADEDKGTSATMEPEESGQVLAETESDVDRQRRQRASPISRRPEAEHLVEESKGYAFFSPGTFSAVAGAVIFAQKALEESRHQEPKPDKKRPKIDPLAAAMTFAWHLLKETRSQDPKLKESKRRVRTEILVPKIYEEAPPVFDLALSDEILQIAIDYMGEAPVLLTPQLWWTEPEGPTAQFRRSQLFHRGRSKGNQRRQAKFLFTMNDVDEASGPFTFLPAGLSEKITRALPNYKMGDRVSDEEMYRYVSPADTLRLVGPPGIGLMVDTCRCFHYGARARDKERLMLMFQFLRPEEVFENRVGRSTAFYEKFGDDPVRSLVIPA